MKRILSAILPVLYLYLTSSVAFGNGPDGKEDSIGWTERVGDVWARYLSQKRKPLEVQQEKVWVPMRDGTRLSADLYRPLLPGSYPAILMRTPYGTGDLSYLAYPLASFGYAVVCQDVRGRGGSEGECRAFLDDGWGFYPIEGHEPNEEHWDGYDSVEWVAGQTWCDRQVGMFGMSALAICALSAAGAEPPHLRCAVSYVAASDIYHDAAHQGGGFRESLVEGWLADIEAEPEVLDLIVLHESYDQLWRNMSGVLRAPMTDVPIYHLGGWYDIFLQGTLNAFMALQGEGKRGAGGNQKVVIGPWTHSGQTTTQQGELNYPLNSAVFESEIARAIDWFDYWLKSEQNGIVDLPPVRYYTMGDVDDLSAPGNEWREASAWPVSATESSLYLGAAGMLKGWMPPGGLEPDSFVYDASNPVPTLGGANLYLDAGPYDQRTLETRSDVLAYTSRILTEPLEVAGRITVSVFGSSSAADTDWAVKLCDVYPDGRSMLVTDGILRAKYREGFETPVPMEPGEVYEFKVDLWSTAIVFNTGHRIRIDVSTSNSPRFERHPLSATNRVYHDRSRPSRLILPVTAPRNHPLFGAIAAVGDYFLAY
jgi:hypothetical protein